MENTLYSPEQYNILWKTSWLSGLSSMYAFCMLFVNNKIQRVSYSFMETNHGYMDGKNLFIVPNT